MKQLGRIRHLLFALFTLLWGCSLLYDTPEVTVKEVSMVGFDPGGIELEILVSVHNPNDTDITLTGYTYDLQVHALPFAEGGSSRKVTFPGNETVDARLPVRVAFSSLYELMKRRPDPDKIPFRLTGTLIVDTTLGEKIVPFTKNGTFAIPKRYRPSGIMESFKNLIETITPDIRLK